jgi:hypothetical protein
MNKKPLYRKENTLARGHHHFTGGDFRHERNTKDFLNLEANRSSMNGKKNRGLDYTPLFKFLISKIGKEWSQIYSEAVSRLDRKEPIFWLVALQEHERQDFVRGGDSSYYSGLFVDEHGLLQIVNPEISAKTLSPFCRCCTHTFNGVVFSKKYEPPQIT